MSTVSHKGLNFGILYTQEQIQKVVASLGQQITAFYKDKIKEGESIVVLCVLKGAFIYCSDLIRHINLPVQVEFVRAKSYQGTNSTGKIHLDAPLSQQKFKDKHILLVDDIHDTGLTLKLLIEELKKLGPKDVNVSTLVIRPDKPIQINLKFYGFSCSDFIIGYGLDFDEFGRHLPHIYQKTE